MFPFLASFSFCCVSVCATNLHGKTIPNHGRVSLHHRSNTPLFGNDTADSPYWLAEITHRGKAPFHVAGGNSSFNGGNSSVPANSTGEYQVFRNVKDYGAKGQCFGISSFVLFLNILFDFGIDCSLYNYSKYLPSKTDLYVSKQLLNSFR